MTAGEARLKIIEIYKERVHGQEPDISKMTGNHDGKIGHWLEDTMGSTRDANNKPDLHGYEMKTGKDMTSFGDWGPNYFIFRDEDKFPNLIGKQGREKQRLGKKNKEEVFLQAFGVWRKTDEDTHKYKLDGKEITWEDIGKKGYYSWSGTPSPNKVTDGFNSYGQALEINDDDSVAITYSFSKDTRVDKLKAVPKRFQIENLKLFGWSQEWIQEKVENKFNVHGWFKCNIKNKKFCEIVFGKKITISLFLEWVRDGDIKFDTRLKETRPDNTDRYGMQWRATSKFWESKSIQTYPEEPQ